MACIAVVNIPQGTYSKPFRISEISVNSLQELQTRGNMKINFPLEVGLASTGEMQPTSATFNIFWPKLIDIASDCHDQNVKLCRWQNMDTLILQATRDITTGQQLQLWFSEELMISELGIPPYLSPLNIKSGNSYVCHECQEEFERPNLLKLHLALHCDRLSSDTIWNRLKSTRTTGLLMNPSYLANLSATPTVSHYPLFSVSPTLALPSNLRQSDSASPPQLLHNSQNSQSHHRLNILQSPEHPSRFNNNSKGATTSSTTSSSTPSSPNIGIEAPVEVPLQGEIPAEANNGRSLVVHEQHHHHARLEAIVSNMGKAKNGHVCLYCGKLYSRKYGLKIHIRTHTGYKPLRCKICHRPFGDPSNLNKHVRLHSDGSTPYRCELCSKVLVRRRDLDRHMRARHHHHHHEASPPTTTRTGTNGIGSGALHLQQQLCSNSSNRSTPTETSTTINGNGVSTSRLQID